jgi:hypothetical protein
MNKFSEITTKIFENLLEIDESIFEVHERSELLHLIVFCSQHLYEKSQKDRCFELLENQQLKTYFLKFTLNSKFMQEIVEIWKIVPKDKDILQMFARIFVVVSLLNDANVKLLFSNELTNLFQEILNVKEENSSLDILFACGNFLHLENAHLSFIREDIFNDIVSFLYCEK